MGTIRPYIEKSCLFLLLGVLLGGCATPPESLVRSYTKHFRPQEVGSSTKPTGIIRLQVQSFDVGRPSRLTLKVTEDVIKETYYQNETVKMGKWCRKKGRFENIADRVNYSVKNDPLTAPAIFVIETMTTAYGVVPTICREAEVPGSRRFTPDTRRWILARGLKDESVVARGVGTYKTDSQGRVSFTLSYEKATQGLRLHLPDRKLAYVIRGGYEKCSPWSSWRILRTGHYIYQIASTIRLVAKLFERSIYPVSFAVAVVVDVATGAVVDYVIDSLRVECKECGHQWEITQVKTSSLNLRCPNRNCGNQDRMHLEIQH